MRTKTTEGEKMMPFDFYLLYIKHTLMWDERKMSFLEFTNKYDQEKATVEISYHDQRSGTELSYISLINQIDLTVVRRMNHIFDIDITNPIKKVKKEFFKIIECDEF